MTACSNALWESLSIGMKHEVAAPAIAWERHRARRIENGMPANSPEVSDDEYDPTMKTGSDDTKLKPALVHAGFTMKQAHAHFIAAMMEEQPAWVPSRHSNRCRRNNGTTCSFS
ncbi:NHL repeat-containing protein 2 [Hordeum vulgare]|nr:NHL repeat-containing protein 2 [Hordeum vulgare]